MTHHIISILFLVVLLAIVVGALILIFEVKMFIAALKNPYLNDTEKAIWCVAMLLIHPFVALAYYFLEDQKPHDRR